jgi:TatD DNase family protein
MLFDSHAHYNDEKFDSDRDELLSAMRENNVGLILNSCSSLDEVPDIFSICEKYPFVYASVGIHPHEVENLTEADMDMLKKYSENPKVKAIGEIGLDYFYDFSPRDVQQKWFARQVDIAREINLPVIIHDRDAHKDCMDILRAHSIKDVGGIFHCYAGSAEMAKEILDWGMYIAFGGSLTFKKSVRPIEVAKYVPLDRIVIETDCPYLTPEPHRGKRNSSLYIHHVAEKLAEIKGLSVQEIENATYENAKRCLGITE